MTEPKEQTDQKTCFVLMPVSDCDGYPQGHWSRVYSHLIKPACEKAGFISLRSDEVQRTNFIVIDILRRLFESSIALCDLSSRNPNVLYELGIRHSFNLPVTLIRDSKTGRIFDVQNLRDVEYDESLRVDLVEKKIEEISSILRGTAEAKGEINSIIELLSLKPAQVPERREVSPDIGLILRGTEDIGSRLTTLELNFTSQQFHAAPSDPFFHLADMIGGSVNYPIGSNGVTLSLGMVSY